MKKLILFLFVISTVFVSCKKDDKNCDFNAANFAGTYRLTAATYKANTATPAVDEFALLPACEKDDLITFNTNGTAIFTDAGVVCTPSGTGSGVWSVSGNTIIFDTEVYDVSSFTCSGTTLSQSGPAAGELFTITLVRQ